MSASAPSPTIHAQQAQAAKLKDLQKDLLTLRVAQQELASLKPGRHVYERQGDLWLLSTPHAATEHVKAQTHSKEKQVKKLAPATTTTGATTAAKGAQR